MVENKSTKKIEEIKKKIVGILEKNKVVRAGIFGSYARGEEDEESDVDILVEVKARKFSLLDLVGLEMELEKRLGRKVDLLTYGGVNHLLKKIILDEDVRII